MPTLFEFEKQVLDMAKQPFCSQRIEAPVQNRVKVGLQNSPRDAAIGAHEINNVLLERRELVRCCRQIENDPKRSLEPGPVAPGNMREHVADMWMGAKVSKDREREFAGCEFLARIAAT